MLLLPPMRGLVALALDQNWYGARERDFVGWQRSRREVARLQGGGGGGGGAGDELNALVWLRQVVRVGRQAIAQATPPAASSSSSSLDKARLPEGKARDLVMNVLAPALRAAATTLWQTYGAPFASLLREVRDDVLLPLDAAFGGGGGSAAAAAAAAAAVAANPYRSLLERIDTFGRAIAGGPGGRGRQQLPLVLDFEADYTGDRVDDKGGSGGGASQRHGRKAGRWAWVQGSRPPGFYADYLPSLPSS